MLQPLRNTLLAVGCLLQLLALALPSAAQDKQPAARKIDWDHEISQLASKNPAPVIKDPLENPEFDTAFRWEDGEERVMTKVGFISAHAAEAMPFLVAHVADKQYAVTHEAGNGYWSNWTVGDLCRGIIHNSIEVRSDVIPNGLRRQSRALVGHEPAAIQKWWTTRQKMELKQLQLEWLQYAIELAMEEELAGDATQDRVRELEAAVANIKKTGAALPRIYSFRLRQP